MSGIEQVKGQIARANRLAKRILDRLTVALLLGFAAKCQAEPASRAR